MADAPRTARARARAAMTDDIKATARRHLGEGGASALSLRAVARDLGVVSSAVYRYFPSRDDLLTALIVDAFDAIGALAEAAAAEPGSPRGRWVGVCRALRAWARAHPHEYALVYGTPVPGYRAPADTVDPAQRVNLAALGLVAEAAMVGGLAAASGPTLEAGVRSDLERVATTFGLALAPEAVAAAVEAWTGVLGHLSYELFGHLDGAGLDLDGLFEHQLQQRAGTVFGPERSG